MKLTPGFAAISILMGMLGLAACGQNSNQAVYQYPETAVLFDNFHILKTVYTSGEMKLLREKTVRSAGSPNHRTTLAGPALRSGEQGKVLHQVRQTVLISLGLMNYEKEKCV